MTQEQAVLFELLRAGLWEKEVEDLSLFPLSADSWQEIYLQARRQTVSGIVYRGLSYLPEAFFPPQPLLIRWVALVDRIEGKNRQMNLLLSQIAGCFRRSGWMAVVQKGQGTASFYESPLLRECGDMDFYFPDPKAGEAVLSAMQAGGCRLKKAPDGSVSYFRKGILIEHHPDLLDLQNPFLRKKISAWIRQYGFEEIALPDGGAEIFVPSPLLHLLLLNTHIMKHAFGLGVGLRQFCDLARAYKSLQGRFDPDELRHLYAKAGIEKWSDLLHAFLTSYMGLSVEYLPYPPGHTCDVRPLLEIVWQGGNFGQYQKGRAEASQSVWLRKIHTFRAFCRNNRFAAAYAPQEVFWTAAKLLKGNI